MRKNVFKGLHFPSSKIPRVLFAEHWPCRTDLNSFVKDNLVSLGQIPKKWLKFLQFTAVLNPTLRRICDYVDISFRNYFGQESTWSLVKFLQEVFSIVIDFQELHGAQEAGT